MVGNKYSIAIFTKNYNFAYRIRTKCKEFGSEVFYFNDIEKIFSFMIHNSQSIILIDAKNTRFVHITSEYAKSVKNCKFVFVYLNDNKETDVEVNNVNSYICSSGEIINVLSQIYQKGITKKFIPGFFFQKTQMISKIIETLDEFHISRMLRGYDYIKECIYVALNIDDKEYNLCKYIYPIVAECFGVKPDSIEKNIRTAIKKAIIQNPDSFNEIKACYGKITNFKLIIFLVEKIKLKLLKDSF